MGLPRKGKAGSKSKSSKKTEGKTKEPKKPQTQLDANKEAQLQLLPQERVLNVKPCWETIPDEDRVELLSVDLDDLRLRAIDLADKAKKQAALEAQEAAELNDGTTITVSLEPGLDEIFEEGTRRLLEKSTWKLWQWPPEEHEFFDADSFRTYAEEQRIDPELRKLLPRDEGKPIEKPAELALRERMAELLQKVHATNRQLQDNMQTQQTRRIGRRDRSSSTDQVPDQIRDSNIELITIILEALEKEHEYLYNAVLYPVTHFVCEMLPEQMRESTRTELFFDDLEKLPSMEVSRMCEWLTEKVDGFSSKTRAEPKEAEEEEEEEGIGDVDLFTLTEDRNKLVVNVKWLQHLQERLLGDDGHPRKVHEGEDPKRMGLVLEWVYGTIVSTAEKARDGAKRALGMQPPTVHQAHDQLLTALQDMLSWEARAKTAKELLNDMLKSRREAAELATQYDIRPDAGRAGIPRHALMAMDGQEDSFVNESAELPDHAIIALLKREHLLTRAKLNALYFEHITGERRLRSLKTQLRQGEPEFDRLKRELEEVKNQPRGLEGTFRTAAEMERHRAQLADAAIEEQLEVQTAFREHGARLQGIYDKRQRTEHEMVHREQEIKQLQGWAQTVLNLINKFEDGLKELGPLAAIEEAESRPASPDEDGFPPEEEVPSAAVATARALTSRARDLTAHRQGIAKLRQHFSKDVRRQLYGDEDDRKFFQWVQSQLKQTEKRLEDGRAVLHHLEAQLINVACDDPGAAIGAQLALPLLQERLDAKAQDFARQKAAQAEEDIIKMEEEKLEKERSERERKLKQKQKAKDKVRSEKEKLAAEKEAAEREARERTEEQQRQQEEQSLAAREAAAMKREELKRAEEELMEARRQELLSEEDGYWRQRMDQQQLVEKLKAEVAEQEELKGHSEDGTDDTTPSSATPADDASDISPVDIPHPKPSSVKEHDPAAATSPMANGFHLPNGSAATDSDGFRRQHERRPSAANGRAGVHNRFGPRIPDQQADDSSRQRPRGVNQRSGSRDRNDGMLNRGSSAEGRDRFPRQGVPPQRDGSTERSDQDRFGPRRFNRDMGRNRRMDRGHPSKEAIRPLPATRQPSANSTVSASRGADGRIEIAAEPPSALCASPLVTREAAAADAKPAAVKPTLLPADTSPTSPLPLEADPTATAGRLPSASLPFASQAPAEVVPAEGRTESGHSPVSHAGPLLARHASAAVAPPAAEPSDAAKPLQPPPGSDTLKLRAEPSAQATTAPHLTLHPASVETSHANGPVTPQSASHSPLAVPASMQAAQHAQQPSQQPQAFRQTHVMQSVPLPHQASLNDPVSEADAIQLPSQASAPLQQAPSFRPKLAPGVVPGASQLPNGYVGPQQHQHPSGPQANLPGPRMRTLPQQQLQQLPRRQPEKSQMQFMPGQGHHHLQSPVLPPHMQGHAGPQAAAEAQGQGMQTGLPGQGRSMPQVHFQQPGSRSSSIGQKRPMPSQDPQDALPHQLTSPQQQRGQPSPSGPPTMGHLPFQGQMHPNGMPHYISSPNGMPPNLSVPMNRALNGMPYSVVPNQRPSMMNHVPMMPANMAMAKPGPMHHQGSMPYGANPYMPGLGQMPTSTSTSSPHTHHPTGSAHSGPQPHSQLHVQPQMPSPGVTQGAPSFAPPQRTASTTGSLPNGHIGPSGSGLSPACSLGNAPSKGSSILRATALPFVPGGMPQPASPMSAQFNPAAQHPQALLQRGPLQLQSGSVMASAAPFFPGSHIAGSRAFPSDAAQRPAESAQGQLEPSSSSGHMAHPGMLEAQHESASNLHSAVPSFMASLLPQDVPSAASVFSRHQPSSSEPSIAPPCTPHPHIAPTPASQPIHPHRPNDSQTSNASTLTADTSQASIPDHIQSDRGRAAADAPEAPTSGPQGDSPKTRWSQVAAATEAGQEAGRPRGNSPSGMNNSGESRPAHAPSSTSSASAATQDGVAEYSRTDSAGSLNRDAGVSERRASHAAAGTSSSLPRDRSASSFTSAPQKPSTGGRCKIVKKHGLVYEDRHDGMRRLKLVRGLSNMFGQYNCFLNVIIQSLWHLPAFRTALLTLPSAVDNGKFSTANGASPRDAAVVRALHNVFAAFSKAPSEAQQTAAQRDAQVQSPSGDSAPAQRLQQQERAESSASAAASETDPAVRQSVSPDELREALSDLEKGQSPVEFELSEMHDAAEVLGEVFNCLHRAQVGSAATGGLDPQLPQLVRVPTASSSGSLSALATSSDPTPTPRPHCASSMAQDVFGQKVQVPCPPEDLDSPISKKARAEVGQWQQQQSRSTASQQRQQAQQQQQQQAAAKRQSKDSSMVDMHQFWKYFHLVPAQAMRVAYDGLNRQGSFEAVLREADSAEALLKRSRQSGAAPLLDITLLNQPKVFTLALVWESAKVAEEAIITTVDALQDQIDLSNLFRGVSPQSNARYVLKSIICYFGHHYQAYAFSEELEQWLLFDDTNIQLIGDWQDVKHMVRSSRLQPSVLFYERSSA